MFSTEDAEFRYNKQQIILSVIVENHNLNNLLKIYNDKSSIKNIVVIYL